MNTPLFARLFKHFTAVITSTGQDEGASDLNLGIGGLLAILAIPGVFVSLSLFDKYSSLLNFIRHRPAYESEIISIPDKYFFIVFSMVVTGVVTTLKWDRIFPSRQDYSNLAPLPLRATMIFLANLAAILFLAAVFAIDVNAGSTLLFPLVVVAGGEAHSGYLEFLAAHACTVILASAFTFFACFAIIGGLLSILPHAAFRRVSTLVRLLILVALMTLLCTTFAVPSKVFKLAANPHSFVRWLPPVWYLAFYQMLQGKAVGPLRELAALAWQATGGSFLLALGCCALSYRRYYQRIPESSDTRQRVPRRPLRLLARLLDPVLLRDPFERACYHFSLRAVLRSETHFILFGAFAGLGLITATQMIVSIPVPRPGAVSSPIPHADLLAAPLCLAYFLMAGLRFSFELPAGLLANWVYRLTVDRNVQKSPNLARKLLLTFLLPIVVLPCLATSVFLWGAAMGLAHTAVVLGFSWLLIEILLVRYRKIPFACSAPAFQNDAILVILIYVIGFFAFTGFVSHLDRWMLLSPLRLLALPPLLALAWYGIRQANYEAGDFDARLVYEARLPDAVQRLDLSGSY